MKKFDLDTLAHLEKALQADDYPSWVKDLRVSAGEVYSQKGGLSNLETEKWRQTSLKDFASRYYHPSLTEMVSHIQDSGCILPEMETYRLQIVNSVILTEKPLQQLANGVIIGSLKSAFDEYPELTRKYFNRLVEKHDDTLTLLNTAAFQNGLFIYVPEGVRFNLQLTFRLDAKVDAAVHLRNLIILEKNAGVNIIQCDDSNAHRSHFATFHSEIYIADNARLQWYNYQNLNNTSGLFTNSYFDLGEKSSLHTYFFQLNGKLLRNEQYVYLNGKQSDARLFGLYLADGKQQFDNVVEVQHLKASAYSVQRYKGILDDASKGFVRGKINVFPNANDTVAYQQNDSILLTDKARIFSQPFLEIYADEVRCSHGSTTGQVDEEALFYMRQRGISRRDAELLQLYAFTGEIIEEIKLHPLVEPTKDLIKKRLNGELETCDNCILQCTDRNATL